VYSLINPLRIFLRRTRSEARSTMQDQKPEPSGALPQHVRALEGLNLPDELIEFLHPRFAELVAVGPLDVVAADFGYECVAAHPDAAVDAPHRPGDAEAAKGAKPRQACW
jgi:hypothetical protein